MVVYVYFRGLYDTVGVQKCVVESKDIPVHAMLSV